MKLECCSGQRSLEVLDADEDAILEKPVDPGEFVEVIRSFEEFRLAVMREDWGGRLLW